MEVFTAAGAAEGLQDAFPAVGVMHHPWQGEGVDSPGAGVPRRAEQEIMTFLIPPGRMEGMKKYEKARY